MGHKNKIKIICIFLIFALVLFMFDTKKVLAIDELILTKSFKSVDDIIQENSNMNKQVLDEIKQRFRNVKDDSLKTEMTVPVDVLLDLSRVGTNPDGSKIYTIIVGNVSPGMGKDNEKRVTAKELNDNYGAGLKIDENGNLDEEYAREHNGWTSYFKLKCDVNVDENLEDIDYTVKIVGVSNSDNLSTNPKEVSNVIEEKVKAIEKKKEQEKKKKEEEERKAKEERQKKINELKNAQFEEIELELDGSREENFNDAKEEIRKNIVDQYFKIDENTYLNNDLEINKQKGIDLNKEVKNEMILPVEIFVEDDFENAELGKKYHVKIKTKEGITIAQYNNTYYPTEINAMFKGNEVINEKEEFAKFANYDVREQLTWDVYLKVKLDFEKGRKPYVFTLTAIDIALDPSELSINPKELEEPEPEEEKEGFLEKVKKLTDLAAEFGKDPLRNTGKMDVETINNNF